MDVILVATLIHIYSLLDLLLIRTKDMDYKGLGSNAL